LNPEEKELEKYPKTFRLKDGQEVIIRELTEDDLSSLHIFFKKLPLQDRLFLRSDVTKKENIRRRYGTLNYDVIYPLIALKNNRIVGEASLFRGESGWKNKLGDIRIVISHDYQRLGLCTILCREVFLKAIKTDMVKIQAEIMETQLSACAAFERMGFKKEALLKNHVTDINGVRRNLIIMSLDIQELWNIMENFIPDPIYVT